MANTMVKIQTITVGASPAASINFTNIPQTFTDLKLVVSGRSNFASNETNVSISFNSSSSNFTGRLLEGSGSGAASYSRTDNLNIFIIPAASSTSSVFGNAEIYIPNYTSSVGKSFSVEGSAENNGTQAFQKLHAGLWSNSAAITAVTVTSQNGNFVQFSSATLYGIKKA